MAERTPTGAGSLFGATVATLRRGIAGAWRVLGPRWALVALPVLLGGLISLVLGGPLGADLPGATSQIYLIADAAGVAWVAGLALSVALAAGAVFWAWATHRCDVRVARAQAAAADERRRFLRRLDHELKNPLTAIRVELANLAAISPSTPSPARSGAATGTADALASVQAQAARIGALVADLRKLAELETRPLSFEDVDLADVLTEVAAAVAEDEVQPAENRRSVTLILPQAPWPLPVIQGDWDLLFLAFYNLAHNACKFTGPDDTVELRAFEDGQAVVVEVADTGPGIPDTEQALVWEELYRAEAARGVPGSGLGLALVRTIVARHGGAATLRSRVGQGTVVTVRLPAG